VVTSRLVTKLYRDIVVNKWQFSAVAVVVMLGVAFYMAGNSSYMNVKTSLDYSYRLLKFGDFNIAFDRAPREVVGQIRRLPGVNAVVGRINVERPLEREGAAVKEIIGRFISLDSDSPTVNALRVVEGRLPQPGHRELALEQGFAAYHKYKVGDPLRIVTAPTHEEVRIVGLVVSPEYIMCVRNKQYGMPTPSQFGVSFLPYDAAENLFELGGQINEVAVRCDPARRGVLIDQVRSILQPYGPEETIVQEAQPSNHMIQQDLQSLAALAGIFPLLFLGAAGLTIYTVLSRIVHSQRPHIGFLRSSGFVPWQIIWHYLSYALVLGVLGSLAGLVFGQWLGGHMTDQYAKVYNIPYLFAPIRWDVSMSAFFTGMSFCFIAGFLPARAGGMIPPAVAMRDEVPPRGRQTPLESIFPGLRRIPSWLKVPLRNLFRSRRRTVSTALGVASGLSLVMVNLMFRDAIHHSISSYFNDVQRYDALVMFIPAQSQDVAFHVKQWPGVLQVEQGLQVPVELIKEGKSVSTMLIARPRGGKLYQVLDPPGVPTRYRGDDLRVGPNIRRKLDLETGDMVLVRYSQSNDDVKCERWLRIGPPMHQPVTSLIYLPLTVAERQFGSALNLPTRPVTGVSLLADPAYLSGLKRRLYELPGATAVELTRETRSDIESMLEFFNLFIYIMLLFGMGMAFAIIFNTLSVNILERTRELAAMRTLGLSRRQIAVMTTVENVLMGLLGLALGIPCGLVLCHYMVGIFESETMSLEIVITTKSYTQLVVGIMLVVLISQIPALRYINNLDLAKATKERGG